jgi:hypothetical protein
MSSHGARTHGQRPRPARRAGIRQRREAAPWLCERVGDPLAGWCSRALPVLRITQDRIELSARPARAFCVSPPLPKGEGNGR